MAKLYVVIDQIFNYRWRQVLNIAVENVRLQYLKEYILDFSIQIPGIYIAKEKIHVVETAACHETSCCELLHLDFCHSRRACLLILTKSISQGSGYHLDQLLLDKCVSRNIVQRKSHSSFVSAADVVGGCQFNRTNEVALLH